MHIKNKGRAEGTQILCQGHDKGKARRMSTFSTLCRQMSKRGKRPGDHQQLLLMFCPEVWEQSIPTDGGGCGRGLRDRKHLGCRVSCRSGCLWPCPFYQQHPPCSLEVKDSLPPWCDSGARLRTNNGLQLARSTTAQDSTSSCTHILCPSSKESQALALAGPRYGAGVAGGTEIT